ncbi:NAD-dependent succinate-semialdehyde dehydrogenase [Anaeromyxobacter paludicola]|uniref:Succinate-semialdehyde dehydrogenase n=1 Tax=Anaeromyxobacter paludicola TaxID=2918171 RepID=A0ABM7XFS2_9BACT|nr:NAD-dependent succinate-semialdehyde dehydrogenase [Anaeromyxobacter paludicola]BDG10683.1 succinate-semialdehyde dehydrogenase [Anaeromyxobacter paludicola]
MKSINPATGEVRRTFDELSDAELEQRLARAAETFPAWRRVPFAERSRLMAAAGALLVAEKEKLGRLLTLEMGKTLASAVAEVEKCASACRYYAEHAERHLADVDLSSGDLRAWVRHLPLGPVLAVMPWNFPFWQVFRFAAPALMAGNVGLLKHASNVPECALAIEDVFRRAGFPAGAFQTLLIGSKRVSQVIADGRVVAVTLTGSDAAGQQVAREAGEALKKVVLELGGSDPFVVMPSADLEQAVKTGVTARMINNGQSCIAAKRFVVHAAIYDRFVERYVERVKALRVGDPLLPETDVGPLSTEAGLRQVEQQVDDSVKAGARCLWGGRRIEGRGFFYAPTVLADIPPAAPAFREEVFGPVALLFRARDLDDAIRIANDTPYGLGSSVWTHDAAERARFVDEFEAGQTFVNAMVASDPRIPFGGVKRSGFGRELARLGILEFVNQKTVLVKDAAAQPARPEAATE